MRIQQQRAPARLSLQDRDTRGAASFQVDNRVQPMAEAEADDHRGRGGYPPAYERLCAATAVNLLEQSLVARERLARLLGW